MLYLHGIGHFHPESVITNRFLEDLDIGTNEAWILERVGIRERRTVLPLDYIRETKNVDPLASHEASLYSDAQMSAAAARMALERANLTPADIGLVVSGCSIPTWSSPAEATMAAAELGIEAPCLDMNSACTTFGMQIDMLGRMAPDRLPPFVLIVQPENITRAVDFSDRSAAILFGDASTAAVVSATVEAPVAVVDSGCGTKPTGWSKVAVPVAGHFRQDGHAVQGFAIRRMTEQIQTVKAAVPEGGRLRFIGHQANMGALQMVCERAGIAAADHWYNVDMFGNTGCAGAASVLSQHWDGLEPGDSVGICIVGAGLTWVHLRLAVKEEDGK